MNNFLWYVSWVPAISFLYFLQSWLTVQNNLYHGNWKWAFLAVSILPPWVLISTFSKNIVFDAMIFDTILIISYTIGLLYFTNSISKFGYSQWFGIFMILVGMILFKKGI